MEPYFYANLCTALGLDQYIDDQGTSDVARREEIRAAFTAAFKTRTADEWHELLNDVDVCAKPVLSLEEALQDEHNIAREMVVEVPTPDGGVMRQAGVAPKLSGTPGRVRGGAPSRGQDTEDLLADLGIDVEVIASLREREIVV